MIRRERPGDHEAIRAVHTAAFGGPDEAGMVDALRTLADPWIGLVAERDGEVVGHLALSPVTVHDGSNGWTAMGIAPMAVLPAHQRAGIGGALVRAGLEACLGAGHPVVFVLGHPEYYPRFGFEPAAPRGLRYRGPEFDGAFFVAELEPGALAGRRGRVTYLPPIETG